MDADKDTESITDSAPTNSDVKASQGVMKSLRSSMRRAAKMSPGLPRHSGSMVKAKVDTETEESGSLSPHPPSPNPSTGSSVSSPIKSIVGLMGKKWEDDAQLSLMKSKLKRTLTDTNPNMAKLGDSLLKTRESIRRNFSKKKANDKTSRQEPVSEGTAEVKQEEEKEKEEEISEEMEETYTLPELPHTPLSVMQISRLIEMEVLEEGYVNLLALRLEFQSENQKFSEDSPMELAKKEKDLNLLYRALRNKVSTIVRNSNLFPSRNKGLLPHVVRIIQEEERRAEEPGGLPDSWMDAWRDAVAEGVQGKVESVHLESQEKTSSWLAIHLGLLGKAIVEDLESVRRELRWSYPPSFNVFNTYISSYHQVVGQHLRKLEQRTTELKDLHALLDWTVNTYNSEKVMGNMSLQPDAHTECLDLQLDDGFLTELKERYCSRAREDVRVMIDKVVELENEEWSNNKPPSQEDGFLYANFPIDIMTVLKARFLGARKIDAQLEQEVISACLEEMKQFPKRFERGFRRNCSSSFCIEYQITYVNGFTKLQTDVDSYQEACPEQVQGFREEVKWLIAVLLQSLEDQFKEDVKLYLRRMMTRKWLTNDEDFDHLYTRTKQLSDHCSLIIPPHAQELASHLHYHLVKEYVGQLMKNNYRCSNRKHERAANKFSHQWKKLRELFEEMGSSYEWLHNVGDDLSPIIGKKKTEIKDNIWPLVLNYPDFSKKHLMAVLDFRGLRRGREHRLILQQFFALRSGRGSSVRDQSRVLFANMSVNVNTDCLYHLPLSCFSVLRPDN